MTEIIPGINLIMEDDNNFKYKVNREPDLRVDYGSLIYNNPITEKLHFIDDQNFFFGSHEKIILNKGQNSLKKRSYSSGLIYKIGSRDILELYSPSDISSWSNVFLDLEQSFEKIKKNNKDAPENFYDYVKQKESFLLKTLIGHKFLPFNNKIIFMEFDEEYFSRFKKLLKNKYKTKADSIKVRKNFLEKNRNKYHI